MKRSLPELKPGKLYDHEMEELAMLDGVMKLETEGVKFLMAHYDHEFLEAVAVVRGYFRQKYRVSYQTAPGLH